ncbi:MAG: response regulator [Acidimicrobiales bacterium]
MRHVLLTTDSDAVLADIESAIGSADVTITRLKEGRAVRAAVLELKPDLVVLDLQIGSMGGIAACLDLRLEEASGRLDPQRILLLLDREADVFLARRSGADGWLIKPLEPRRVERAVAAIAAGQQVIEGPALAEA